MTATIPSAALATIQPVFTDAERLALAGFLAGYRGLTRETYTLDLRHFTAWCSARSPSAVFRPRTSRPSPASSRRKAGLAPFCWHGEMDSRVIRAPCGDNGEPGKACA